MLKVRGIIMSKFRVENEQILENKLKKIASEIPKENRNLPFNDEKVSGYLNIDDANPTSFKKDKIKVRDHYTCAYCGRDLSKALDELQIDHVIPKAQGGNKEESNLVVACQACNEVKGYDEIIFKDLYQFYINNTNKTIDNIQPHQLVKKIRNIGYPFYMTLFRVVDTNGEGGNRFKYNNHTQIESRGFISLNKDNVKPWKDEYEEKLTAIDSEEAQKIISVGESIAKKCSQLVVKDEKNFKNRLF